MPDGQVGRPAMDLVPRYKEEHVFIIEAFIVHSVRESGRKGVILGLSGGIDSALVAKLCADAIGPERVLALALPDGKGWKDLKDAQRFAKSTGIEFQVVDIGPIAAAFEKRLQASEADPIARGNLRARARMTVLYYGANTEDRVVMGTGNKSEILTGYATKFGDAGADFLPIGDLYKTQVREMAVHLGVPPEIVEKTPTAGLWPGETHAGGRRSRTEMRFVRPPVTKRAGCPRGRWIPSGTRVRLASSDRTIDSMSEKGITARKYHPWRRMIRERVIQCSVKRGETTKRRAYAAMTTPISPTVSPGGTGLSATETARAAVRPATRRVRLRAWARPYAKVSRLGTGPGQRSHRIRIRSPKSDVENECLLRSKGEAPRHRVVSLGA